MALPTNQSSNSDSNSGPYSRIRAAAACSTLDRNTRLAVRHSRRGGYEIYANGNRSPVRCETWAEARTILLELGISRDRMDEIGNRLVEGKGLVLRRQL